MTGLLCISFLSFAQTSVPFGKQGERRSGSVSLGSSPKELIITPKVDMKSLPVEYEKFSDARLEELEREMSERSWGSEDTAWERACVLNTRDAYMKYVAMYPNGEHRPEANKRIIDIEVEDILNHEHEELPGITRVEEDDDSPTSTIVIKNNTQYRLTVMYSGSESKSIAIAPGGRGTLTVKNGRYNIAASVPPAHIRPYAGSTTLEGGRYETGYWVVTSWY